MSSEHQMNKYKEIPCKCGFTYENNKDEYETYHMRIGSIRGKELPKKPIPRCRTCKTISLIERTDILMECCPICWNELVACVCI